MVAEASDALAGLCVPQFDVAVIAGTDKVCAVVIEADILHSFAMTYSEYTTQHIYT